MAQPWARGDALLASGQCRQAVAEYGRALQRPLAPDDTARTTFFRALARLDCDTSGSPEQAFAELRAVERDHAQTVWGGLARVFVDDIIRQEALRQTVARLEGRQQALDDSIEEYEQQLHEASDARESIHGQLAVAREERRKLQAALDEATEEGESLRARVEELTQELADLKRIDMEREP